MEARVTSGTKIPRFSLLGVLALVFAGAVHLLYGYLVWLSRQLFVPTADEWYLVNVHALKYGLPRKAATFAEGRVQLQGTPATVVPEGTVLQNSAGLQYVTVSEAILDGVGFALADIQATTAGEAGNTSDASLFLYNPLVGVNTAATVQVAPTGGQDVETVEELRARLLQRTQNPPSSGTASDYVRWALEVEGVGKAWCLPAEEYAGPGTVGIVVATSDLGVVDPAVKADAQAYIDTVRPVGAQATVEDIVPVLVVYDISITPNTQDIRDAVDTNLRNLHLIEAEPGGVFLLSRIRSAVSSSGATDYDITEIYTDGTPQGVANIATAGLQVPSYDHSNYSAL